jgi:hypothetical protein
LNALKGIVILGAFGVSLTIAVVTASPDAKGGDKNAGTTTGLVTTAPGPDDHSRLVQLRRRFKRLQTYSVRVERERNGLRRTLLRTPTVGEAINLACTVYGHCSELWRKARCESGLSSDPPHNNDARGLFQFLHSTWRSTPYGRYSVFSAYANALAAGWMHAAGRGGEWVCQ